jgi:hypothetical protein
MRDLPDGLEMGCVRPGHWVIEGWTVERDASRPRTQLWRAMSWPDREPLFGPTLTDVCHQIADYVDAAQ